AVHRWSRIKTHLEGLRDAPALLAHLRPLAGGLLLHGHLHRRIQRAVPGAAGGLLQVGATSASLHNDAADRVAGFNMYDVGEAGGPASILAHVYSPATGEFHVESVPRYV